MNFLSEDYYERKQEYLTMAKLSLLVFASLVMVGMTTLPPIQTITIAIVMIVVLLAAWGTRRQIIESQKRKSLSIKFAPAVPSQHMSSFNLELIKLARELKEEKEKKIKGKVDISFEKPTKKLTIKKNEPSQKTNGRTVHLEQVEKTQNHPIEQKPESSLPKIFRLKTTETDFSKRKPQLMIGDNLRNVFEPIFDINHGETITPEKKVKRGLGKFGNMFQTTVPEESTEAGKKFDSGQKKPKTMDFKANLFNPIDSSFSKKPDADVMFKKVVANGDNKLFKPPTIVNDPTKSQVFYSPSRIQPAKPTLPVNLADDYNKTSIIHELEDTRPRKINESFEQEVQQPSKINLGNLASKNLFVPTVDKSSNNVEPKKIDFNAPLRVSSRFEEEKEDEPKNSHLQSTQKEKPSSQVHPPVTPVEKKPKGELNAADLKIMAKMFDRLTEKCKTLTSSEKAAYQNDIDKITEFFAKICYEIDEHFVKRCEELLAVFLAAQNDQPKFMFLLRELCIKIFSDLRSRIKSSKIVIVI